MTKSTPAPDAVRLVPVSAIVDFDVEDYVSDYEFRADEDGGAYTPTEEQKALITDAIHGVLSDICLLAAAPAPATARGGDAAWTWEATGTDADGDPLTIKGKFGDYDARVTLSRTTRTWSSTVNNGHGRLDYATEEAAKAYAEETVAGLLKARLEAAEKTLALYATLASQPQATGGAVEREAGALSETEKIDELARWLHDEVDWPDFVPDCHWPLSDDDDGYRGNGGYVRIQPKFAVERFRDIAERIVKSGVAALATQPAPSPGGWPHVFLDCDGVLADFDTYAHDYFGMNPREYEKRVGSKQFWQELEAKGDFYRNLPLMPDAMALYEGVKHLNPTILTGCPRGNWAEAQKVAWAHEHFPGVPVITCRSADKRVHAKPGDVLIDDWPQHRHRWIEHGGVFITHHDAETSLAALWAHYPALLPAAPSIQKGDEG